MDTKKTEDSIRNYYLVAGSVTARIQKGTEPSMEDDAITMTVNSILQTEPDSTNITVSQIGRTQQALQIEFMKKMGNDPQIIPQAVVITSLVHLGVMKPSEFNDVKPSK